MFDGLTHVSDGIFYGGLIAVVLVCVIAIVVVAIRGALAMDRDAKARRPASFVDDIDWDAVDQEAAQTIQSQPSIVAGAFGKARH